MRLWKKVTTMAAIVAMSVTMAVPAMASAEEVSARIGGCKSHGWEYAERYGDVVDYKFHTLEDGSDCQINVTQLVQYQYCNDCGIQQTIGYTYVDRHMNLDCPEAD